MIKRLSMLQEKICKCEYQGCTRPAKWVLHSEDPLLPKKWGDLHLICTQHRNILVPDLQPAMAVKSEMTFEQAAPARKVLWK